MRPRFSRVKQLFVSSNSLVAIFNAVYQSLQIRILSAQVFPPECITRPIIYLYMVVVSRSPPPNLVLVMTTRLHGKLTPIDKVLVQKTTLINLFRYAHSTAWRSALDRPAWCTPTPFYRYKRQESDISGCSSRQRFSGFSSMAWFAYNSHDALDSQNTKHSPSFVNPCKSSLSHLLSTYDKSSTSDLSSLISYIFLPYLIHCLTLVL